MTRRLSHPQSRRRRRDGYGSFVHVLSFARPFWRPRRSRPGNAPRPAPAAAPAPDIAPSALKLVAPARKLEDA